MSVDPARAAYEARFADMTLGPCGAAPAWNDLPPEGKAVWQRVAQAAVAAALKPTGERPCDCERCDCGNVGDAAEVAEWDAQQRAYEAALSALSAPSQEARDA
ncbi:hypothetical protein [Methylobacterium nodulans]|uniref:Uncharacterized protein n=1 Tax=Methylobacterium nodulans (strain LMG 21967 / CNCM I-2342 / ORS 2060) TaxID=460265 RepID=B8INZ5_METNO|nr:hypothetical protein [Methylobacterium nodulans]ACL58511.1 hypothetical protein Mnod_3602 [Methylobacterium nodulans ORS 2060]